MKERRTKKHRQFSIEEKNQIVLLYLDRHMGMIEILRQYDIPYKSVVQRWIKQYQEFGTCVDHRGKGGTKRGRPRKNTVPLEELTKKDLIEMVRMYKDIKNSLACVMNRKQDTTTKS